MKTIDQNHYQKILNQVITEIKSARMAVAHRINSSLIQLYWSIGRRLSEEGLEKGYGSGVVENLSRDLKIEFPEMSGFSPRNLWYMKQFYEFYSQGDIKLQQAAAVLPWMHNVLIITKTVSIDEARFYVESAIEMGWTRDVLLNFIKGDAYASTKVWPKQHNFDKVLPEYLQRQAEEMLKSTYSFDFLGIRKSVQERELEKRLVEKIKGFLLELGKGFSFIGSQYRLTLGPKEYFVDMLFFNRTMRALVAIDLKIGSFEPEYVGKMNFYLGLLDRQAKMSDENPSIGIVLCASKNQVEVEVALQDVNKPIGVADYRLQFPANQLKELIRKEMENRETDFA